MAEKNGKIGHLFGLIRVRYAFSCALVLGLALCFCEQQLKVEHFPGCVILETAHKVQVDALESEDLVDHDNLFSMTLAQGKAVGRRLDMQEAGQADWVAYWGRDLHSLLSLIMPTIAMIAPVVESPMTTKQMLSTM
jgi:hypothetical protein